MRDPRSTSSPSSCDSRQRTPLSLDVVPDREHGSRSEYAPTIWLVSPKFPDSPTDSPIVPIHLATTTHHLALNNPLGVALHLISRDS
jgi:hypothetical protein